MKKVVVFIFCSWTLLILNGCSKKESNNYVDLETIDKDDAFRARVATGHFIKLSKGYVYYEFENPDVDTLLVLVHGFSVPSYVWDSTFHAARRRGFGVLRYDNYGRGFSDNPDVTYDVALYSGQLQELLDSLHVTKKINLFGLSDGGRTISGFASQFPDRIVNLVYVDPAGFNNVVPIKDVSVSPEEIDAFKRERYPTMAIGQLGDFYDSIPFRGWDKKYKELMRYKGFVRALISTNKNRASLEQEHRSIAASGIPVAVIWGEFDQVVRLEEARPILMERMPKANLYVIGNAGHLPQMEQAKQFNQIVFDQIVARKKV